MVRLAALLSIALLLSSCLGMQQVMPFIPGDVWRGHLSACSSIPAFSIASDVHVVDMTVISGDPDNLRCLFTEQTTKSEYVMKGQFSPSTLEFALSFDKWVHQPDSSWTPCEAVGVVGRDLSVLTGDAVCQSKNGAKSKCAWAGGGEFILRHDRTQFTVDGAGDPTVNGRYSSIPKNHNLFDIETYEGVPMYKQVSCDPSAVAPPIARGGCELNHVMAQRVVGNQKFWILTDIDSLHSHDRPASQKNEMEPADVFETIKYSVWSEDVTPPMSGWRAREYFHGRAELPAPMVNPVIGSMMALEGMLHPMTAEKRMKDMLAESGLAAQGGGGGGVLGFMIIGVVVTGVIFTFCTKRKGGARRG
jgi:hypothetical protein